jgi:hypothetical protein
MDLGYRTTSMGSSIVAFNLYDDRSFAGCPILTEYRRLRGVRPAAPGIYENAHENRLPAVEFQRHVRRSTLANYSLLD